MFIRKTQCQRALATLRDDLEREIARYRDELNAIRQNLAYIEFTPEGIILDANDSFLAATGYTLDEVRGHHHRMFCPPADTATEEYAAFWHDLAQGPPRRNTFGRLTKSGQTVWLEASYFPVRNAAGKIVKIIKIAHANTELTRQIACQIGRIREISTSGQAKVQHVRARIVGVDDSVANLLDIVTHLEA